MLVCGSNELVDSILIENIVTIHALNNGAGSLALSEAGDGYAALVLIECLVYGLVEFLGIDFDLKACGLGVFLFYVLD